MNPEISEKKWAETRIFFLFSPENIAALLFTHYWPDTQTHTSQLFGVVNYTNFKKKGKKNK